MEPFLMPFHALKAADMSAARHAAALHKNKNVEISTILRFTQINLKFSE